MMIVAIGWCTTASAATIGDGAKIFGYNWGYFVLGIGILAGLVYLYKCPANLKKPMLGLAVGGILLGAVVGFAPYEAADTTPPPGATVAGLTFDVDVTNGTTGVGNQTTVQINEAETMATILLETAGTGGDQPLCGTHASINFTFDPNPPIGANADDLATVYFSTPYQMKYNGEYVLDESSDTYYANWTFASGDNDASQQDYEGSMTMLMTETGYAEIDYEFDSGSSDCFSAELDTIGDTGSWYIDFWTADHGWSETFLVTWILVEQ